MGVVEYDVEGGDGENEKYIFSNFLLNQEYFLSGSKSRSTIDIGS